MKQKKKYSPLEQKLILSKAIMRTSLKETPRKKSGKTAIEALIKAYPQRFFLQKIYNKALMILKQQFQSKNKNFKKSQKKIQIEKDTIPEQVLYKNKHKSLKMSQITFQKD